MENEKHDIEKLYKKFMEQTGSPILRDTQRGYPTLADITNVKVAYHQYKTSERVLEAVGSFSRTSTKLTRWLLVLSIIMTLLVGIQVVPSIKQWVTPIIEKQPVSEVVGTEGGDR